MRWIRDALLAGAACLLLTAIGSAAPIPLSLSPGPSPNAVTLFYDPVDGDLRAEGGGVDLTTLELHSSGNRFIKAGITPPTSPFDIIKPEKLFRLSADGTSGMNFGQVLPTAMSGQQIIEDLLVDGSFLGGGDLRSRGGGGPYIAVVPEPGNLRLLMIGIAGAIARWRRK